MLLGRRASAGPAACERGSVLLETAIAIPVLVAVAAGLIWAVGIAGAALALGDAARTAARDLARGVPLDQVRSAVLATAPDAVLTLGERGDLVEVTLSRRVSVPGGWLSGLGIDVRQSAQVSVE